MSKQTLSTALRAVVITLLLVSTLVASTPPAVAASTFIVVRSVWGTPTSPTVVYPGDQSVKLSIVVQNTGPDSCSAITPIISPLGPPFRSEDGSYDQAVGTSSKTSLTVGDTAVFEFTLNIDPNASPGTYLRTLIINYRISGIQYSTTLTITLPISQPPRFMVLQTVWGTPNSPKPAEPGEKGATLSVSIQNPAPHPIYALVGALYLTYPFSSPAGDKTVASSIAPTLASGATATAVFTLDIDKGASVGAYQLTLKLTYLDHWYTQLTQNLTLLVYLPGKSEIVIADVNSTLTLGEENTIAFSIKNVGSAPAYKLSASISTVSGILIDPSKSTQYFQDLPPGGSIEFKVNATAPRNLTPGFYQAQIEVSYTDTYGNIVSKRFSSSIVVKAPPFQRVEVVKSYWGGVSATQPVHPGDKNVPLYVIIQNLNPYAISGVKATLILPETLSNVTGGSTIRASYPNPLSSGQTATLDFTINVKESAAAGLYRATLSISYQDPSSALYLVESVLELPIVDPQPLQILNAVWGTLNNPTPAAPGDKAATLTLLIRNTQTYAISAINATLHLTKPYTNITGGYSVKAYSDALVSPGNSFTLQFLINIDEEAAVGYYNLNLSLTYVDLWSTRQQQTIPVNVRLDGRSRITVIPVATTLHPGSEDTITLKISNIGSASAYSLLASLKLPSGTPITLDPNGVEQRFGEIKPGDSITFNVKASTPPDAAVGAYQATLSLSFRDSYGSPSSESKMVLLNVEAKPASLQVREAVWGTPNSPTAVGPGDKGVTLSLTLQNTEPYTISGLLGYLTLPKQFTNATGGHVASAYYQSPISPGQFATLKFTLNIREDAAIGTYQLTFTPYYVERGSLKQGQNVTITVLLTGRADLNLRLDGDRLVAGAVNRVLLAVENRGSASATDLHISLTLPSTLRVEGEGSWRIGELRAGEERLLPIQLYVSPNVAAGSMLDVVVSLKYMVSDIAVSDTKSIRLLVSPSSTGQLNIKPKTAYLVDGAINSVEVQVTNTLDRPIANITALLSSNSASALSDRFEHRGALQPQQSISLNFTIRVPKNIQETSIQMQLSLSYLDERLGARSEVYTLTLPVKEYSSPLLITTDSFSLIAGSVNTPAISINNVGSQDLSSVEVNLSSSLGILSIMAGSERWFFQTIPSGGSVVVKPKVFASLASTDSLQSLTLTLSYFDHLGNWRKESRSLIFLVQGSIKISFQSVQASPSTIQAGGNFTVTGNLINKGSREAYYATVSIKPNVNFQAGSQYIGDLTVNTPIPFSLTVSSSRAIRNGTYPLTIVVEYEDSYGVKHSEEYSLQINVTTRSATQVVQTAVSQVQESLRTLRYIFLIALAAILAGGAFTILKVYRRRRVSYAHT